MKGLILCGGLGTRLLPITLSIPKQLISIANKPLIFYTIDSLIKANIRDIGIVVNDNEQMFREILINYKDKDIAFKFIRQTESLGIADAIYSSCEFIGQDNFITVLGDILCELDAGKFIDDFEKESMNCKILVKEVNEPRRYVVAKVADGKIIDLIKNPKNPPSNLAVAGAYVFDKSIFEACKNIEKSEHGEYEITDAIKWLIDNDYKVNFGILEEWWKDIGSPKDIINANHYKISKIGTKLNGTIDEKSELIGAVETGENTKIYNSRIRGPVVIGDDTIIENSYIGPYSSIGKKVRIINAEIENSIISDGCVISNIDSIVDSSIIERNCIITKQTNNRKVNSFILGKNSKITIN